MNSLTKRTIMKKLNYPIKLSLLVITICGALILKSCGTSETPIINSHNTITELSELAMEVINKPFDHVSENIRLFLVSPNEPTELKLDNGSVIKIPANAFTFLDGSPVTEKATIEYEEFHSLADIILSGIPMTYDSAGVEENLVSAGMFTIDGHVNGTPIKVAKGKELDVTVASYQEDTPCYNFYELNEKGNWDYQTSKKAEINKERRNDIIPVAPKETESSELVLQLDAVGFGGALDAVDDILWKYDGNREDTLNKKMLGTANFGDFKLEKSTRGYYSYDLKLKVGKKKQTIPVTPAFSGEDLALAQAAFESQLASFKTGVASAKILAQKPYTRNMNINGFGTFNWDVICRNPNRVKVLASFDYGTDEIDESLVQVFLVCEELNMVVKYGASTFKKFSFEPGLDHKIVATLPNDRVAICTAKEFKSINKSQPNIHFNLKLFPKDVTNSEELTSLIESI